MRLFMPERALVQAAVVLGNAAAATGAVASKRLRARPRPTKAWAKFMAIANAMNGPFGVDHLITPPSAARAAEVLSWLDAVAKNDVDNLAEVLDQYIQGIELRLAIQSRGARVGLVLTGAVAAMRLAALGTALLLDPDGEWRGRFGRCKACNQFFLDARQGKGPKRQTVCSQRCRDAEKYQRRKELLAGRREKNLRKKELKV